MDLEKRIVKAMGIEVALRSWAGMQLTEVG